MLLALSCSANWWRNCSFNCPNSWNLDAKEQDTLLEIDHDRHRHTSVVVRWSPVLSLEFDSRDSSARHVLVQQWPRESRGILSNARRTLHWPVLGFPLFSLWLRSQNTRWSTIDLSARDHFAHASNHAQWCLSVRWIVYERKPHHATVRRSSCVLCCSIDWTPRERAWSSVIKRQESVSSTHAFFFFPVSSSFR